MSMKNADYVSMTQPHAAGSLLSSVDDLARWDESLTTLDLLTRSSYERMTTRYVLKNGERSPRSRESVNELPPSWLPRLARSIAFRRPVI